MVFIFRHMEPLDWTSQVMWMKSASAAALALTWWLCLAELTGTKTGLVSIRDFLQRRVRYEIYKNSMLDSD